MLQNMCEHNEINVFLVLKTALVSLFSIQKCCIGTLRKLQFVPSIFPKFIFLGLSNQEQHELNFKSGWYFYFTFWDVIPHSINHGHIQNIADRVLVPLFYSRRYSKLNAKYNLRFILAKPIKDVFAIKNFDGAGLTSCISGARVTALSTHLPVITISAPKSSALFIGPALKKEKNKSIKKNFMACFLK